MNARTPHARRKAPFCLALLSLLTVNLITACSGESPSQPALAEVARIQITPDSAVVTVGQTQSFSVRVFTASGAEMTGRTAVWSSTNQAFATIDNNGVATGVGAGTTSIAVTVDGKNASASLRVREPAPARVTISPDSAVIFIGHFQTLTARAYDAAGAELRGRTVVWSTSDEKVVSVTGAGAVTARGPGSAKITATVEGTAATIPVRARENPVKATSYENFKSVGVQPHSIPLPKTSNWGFSENARAYGDFFGRGRLDMFTSTVDYDLNQTAETAQKAVFRFWRKEGDTYVQDNSIVVPGGTPCLHDRKALVADFNVDGRPDIFLACTGIDKAPYPGERNRIFLSQSDGRYLLREASPDVGFWHGAAAADLNGDGYPDVVAVAGGVRAVFLNKRDGTFVREAAARMPDFGGRIYFTTELVDVDEDGKLDLLLGGHEWEAAGDQHKVSHTGVWLNPGNNDFSKVTPVVIPAVPNEGVVLDFTVTGTGSSRTIWVNRSSGGDGTFYQSAVMQRFNWSSRTAEVVYNKRPAHWVPWIISYTRGGIQYVGSDDLRTPMEVVVR